MSYTQCVVENGKCKYCSKSGKELKMSDMCYKPHLNPNSYEWRAARSREQGGEKWAS